MTVTQVKRAIQAVLLPLPGMGVIDLHRLDADNLPRGLGTHGRDADGQPRPYWSVQARGLGDRPAGFGDTTARPVFRTYRIQLEGWLGFVGADDTYLEGWEELTERVANQLQVSHRQMNAVAAGFQDWVNFAVPQLDIVQLSQTTRAHHALLSLDAQFFLRLRV